MTYDQQNPNCDVTKPSRRGHSRTLTLRTARPESDADAENTFVASVFDLSERQLVTQLVRSSERLLTSTFNALQDTVMVIDRELRVVVSNGQGLISRADGSAKCHECFFGHQVPCPNCCVRKVFETGEPVSQEMVEPRFRRVFEVRAFPIADDAGDVTLVAEHVREITDRKRAEESLQESEALFRAITENSGDLTIIVDRAGHIKYLSPAITRITGQRPEELLGKPPRRFMHPDDVATVDEAIEFARTQQRRGQPQSIQGRMRHCDGHWVWLEATVTSMLDVPGVDGIVANVRDITERIQTQRELQSYAAAMRESNESLARLNRQAEAATRAKSEFLANMSHEIRTPLTAIMGFAEMLLTEGDIGKAPPQRIEAVHTIIRNSDYLLRLINDILDLSKIEAGKMEIERQTVTLRELVDEVVQLTQLRAREKQLPIHVSYESAVPTLIHTDPTRLRQVLINLVANAIKFTESGHVGISIRYERDGRNGPELQFAVSDTGIGMSEEQLQRLFQPFTQADGSTTRRFGGTGLGLSISKRLVEWLGGRIEVTSQPGQGSTFRVSIDPGKVDGASFILPIGNAPQSHDAAVARPAASPVDLNHRILLAEDALDTQRLVKVILAKAGAEVVCVTDGQAAFETALAARRDGTPFDLILMDMQMPVLDGYEATRRLRLANYQGPIVALTAHAMSGEREKCLNAGCDGYATKPINREALLQTVAQFALKIHPTKSP